MPFQPDYLQTIVGVSWGGDMWLVIHGAMSRPFGEPPAPFDLFNFNPSPSGFAEITLCNFASAGNMPRGVRLTPQQLQIPLIHFVSQGTGGITDGMALLNLSKVARNFPNPTFQFDVRISPAGIVGGDVLCLLGNGPIGAKFLGAPAPPFIFKKHRGTHVRNSEFTGNPTVFVPWIARVFVDMSKIAGQGDRSEAFSSETIQVGNIPLL